MLLGYSTTFLKKISGILMSRSRHSILVTNTTTNGSESDLMCLGFYQVFLDTFIFQGIVKNSLVLEGGCGSTHL